MSIKMKSIRGSFGDYGMVYPGDIFEVADEESAISLESRGIAERYIEAPIVLKMRTPENKMWSAQENKSDSFPLKRKKA